MKNYHQGNTLRRRWQIQRREKKGLKHQEGRKRGPSNIVKNQYTLSLRWGGGWTEGTSRHVGAGGNSGRMEFPEICNVGKKKGCKMGPWEKGESARSAGG